MEKAPGHWKVTGGFFVAFDTPFSTLYNARNAQLGLSQIGASHAARNMI
jgi:hypothetical protein